MPITPTPYRNPLAPRTPTRPPTTTVPRTGANPAVPNAPQLPGGVDESVATGGDLPAVPTTTVVPDLPTLSPVPVGGATTAGPTATGTIIPRTQPSTPTQGTGLPQIPPAPITEPMRPQGTAGGSGPTLTPTDPANPLTGQTIAPGAGADRFKVAQERYDTFVKGSDPQYQAALRDATRRGAAMGGIGSGMLRTSYGDLAAGQADKLANERARVFQDALIGSIDDSRFATGVAQQQQGFQSEQQRTAFANELARLGLTDQLTNSDFQRALQTWLAGQQGGTGSGTAVAGANNTANNANSSLDALMAWIAAQNANRPASGAAPGFAPPPPTSATGGY